MQLTNSQSDDVDDNNNPLIKKKIMILKMIVTP
jgi:hypothetical protein